MEWQPAKNLVCLQRMARQVFTLRFNTSSYSVKETISASCRWLGSCDWDSLTSIGKYMACAYNMATACDQKPSSPDSLWHGTSCQRYKGFWATSCAWFRILSASDCRWLYQDISLAMPYHPEQGQNEEWNLAWLTADLHWEICVLCKLCEWQVAILSLATLHRLEEIQDHKWNVEWLTSCQKFCVLESGEPGFAFWRQITAFILAFVIIVGNILLPSEGTR